MRGTVCLGVLVLAGSCMIWSAGHAAFSQSRAMEDPGSIQDCSYVRRAKPAVAAQVKSSPDILIEYKEPERYMRCKEYLQDNTFLEGLRDFLVQMRWPYTFTLVAKVCNEEEARGFAFYSAYDRSITICYQSVSKLFKMAPKPDRPESVEIGSSVIPDISRDEFIGGELIATALHESGHAVFHMMNVPVFGREEDAADQFASLLVLVQERKEIRDYTKQIIRADVYFWHQESKRCGGPNLFYECADVHSSAIQRLYNIACLAYGSDPEGFKEFEKLVEKRNCKAEYEQVKAAGLKTITPYMAGN